MGAQRCSRLVTQLLTLARNEPEARLQWPAFFLESEVDIAAQRLRRPMAGGFLGDAGEIERQQG